MSTPLHQLRELGQNVWYDNIRRALLDSGQLRDHLADYAVTGDVEPEPLRGRDRRQQRLPRAGCARRRPGSRPHPEELFWQLAIRDIRDTADPLRDVHETSGGADGFVSLELPPRLVP